MTDLDKALAAAREALAIDVPADHAARVTTAALATAQTAPSHAPRTWWSTALPIAWRAAALVDAAAIAVVVWLAVRAPEVPSPRPAAPDPVGAILDDETAALLARALRLPSPAPEVAP
jgi:hypothetical protein